MTHEKSRRESIGKTIGIQLLELHLLMSPFACPVLNWTPLTVTCSKHLLLLLQKSKHSQRKKNSGSVFPVRW